MVIVISEEADISTRNILDWLIYMGKPFLRINNTDNIKIKNLKLSNDDLDFEIYFRDNCEKLVRAKNIRSVWLRRGELRLDDSNIQKSSELEQDFGPGITRYLAREHFFFNLSLYKFIKAAAQVNIDNIETSVNRKLENLLIAKQVGFNIPPTAIVQSKDEFLSFYNEHENGVITKSISEGMGFAKGDDQVAFITSILNKYDLINLPDKFPPSLIQKQIPRKLELRVFYLKGKVFPAAILSSGKSAPMVDQRSMDSKSIRVIPYKLADEYISKLHEFMNLMGRDTGSFDFIQTPLNELYFLEINPVGQFAFVSDNCNYFIEKQIAEQL